MYIETENAGFKPNNFVIYKFYGKDTCFAWKENELVVFPFSDAESENSTLPLKVLTAPGVIKSIQNFEERAFVICTPCGIYKLTEKLLFAILSKSGIGMGTLFSKVFTLQGRCINLEDKHDKSLKKLFQVPSETVTSDELSSLKLIAGDTDEEFRTAFLEDNGRDELCLISCGKVLYKQTKNVVKIVYSCDYTIKEILPIEKKGKIVGASLLTTNSSAVILMYIQEKKLKFDKIYLNHDDINVQAFCATMNENSISIVYSTNFKTYQCRKKFNLNALQNVRVEERAFIVLRIYKSNFVVGLTAYKELIQFALQEVVEENSQDDSAFVELKLSMMQGTEVIVEKICEKAKELQTLTEKLEVERDILKRINLYAYDYHEEYCPELRIKKIGDEKYLAAKFEGVLPVNSQVILAASRGDRRTFNIKKVTDAETEINLSLPTQNTSKSVNVTVDLITYNPKEEPVCLIKDFIEDPNTNKDKQTNLSPEKVNFVNLKIRALKNLITDGKVTMKALSEIKNSIRRELKKVES